MATITLTFEGLPIRLLKEVLLVAGIRDMSNSLLLDLSEREDTERTMLGLQVVVAAGLMWRIVDMAGDFDTFNEYRSIFC